MTQIEMTQTEVRQTEVRQMGPLWAIGVTPGNDTPSLFRSSEKESSGSAGTRA
jgi:hypothetical protein